MNYIGSKDRLIGTLIAQAIAITGLTSGRFADVFAGTHAVGRAMQAAGWDVLANDIQEYSRQVGHSRLFTEYLAFESLEGELFPSTLPVESRLGVVMEHLNHRIDSPESSGVLDVIPTWFMDKYGEGGSDGRLYFSKSNALKITIARHIVENWILTDQEYHILSAAIIHAADKVANVATVYYTYLKKLKASALKPLRLEVPVINEGPRAIVKRLDGVDFLNHIKEVDVVYLDPPYNGRQYAGYYHLLETIACWDNPISAGVGGVRPWQDKKSAWCSRATAPLELINTIESAQASWVMLSYSSDGLMTHEGILDTLKGFGTMTVLEQEYPRLKTKQSDSDAPVLERLYLLKCD